MTLPIREQALPSWGASFAFSLIVSLLPLVHRNRPASPAVISCLYTRKKEERGH